MLFRRLQNFWSVQQKDTLWISAFILLLALLPLPFGSNRPWASDLYAVLSGLLLVNMVWADRNINFISGNALRKRIVISAGLFSLVIVWSFFQIVPWAPSAWQHPLWHEAANVLGPIKGSISVDPGLFPESLLRLLSYAATFLLAYGASRNPQHAKRIVHTLAFAGIAYAAYGIVVESTGGDTILWYKKWAYQGFVTSTFVNKNSYATYAGLGLLCCMAFLFHHFSAFKPKDAILARSSKTMAVIASLGLRDYAYLLFPVLLIAALALTGSRAGVASTMLGGTAFLASLAVNKKWKLRQWTVLLLVAGILFFAFVGLGGDSLLLRVDERAIHNDTTMRLAGYKLTLQALHDNPWLGFGLGTFDSAFRLYRDSSLPLWFHHAHNDYLEMMMDLGLPSACLLFAAILLMVSCTMTGIRQRRRDGVYPALALGASVLVGTHAFFDFSMHIPAIAAAYAALLGTGVAQSTSSQSQQAAPSAKTRIAPVVIGKQGGQPKARTAISPTAKAEAQTTTPVKQAKPTFASAAEPLTKAHDLPHPEETPSALPLVLLDPEVITKPERVTAPTELVVHDSTPGPALIDKTKKRHKHRKKKK